MLHRLDLSCPVKSFHSRLQSGLASPMRQVSGPILPTSHLPLCHGRASDRCPNTTSAAFLTQNRICWCPFGCQWQRHHCAREVMDPAKDACVCSQGVLSKGGEMAQVYPGLRDNQLVAGRLRCPLKYRLRPAEHLGPRGVPARGPHAGG